MKIDNVLNPTSETPPTSGTARATEATPTSASSKMKLPKLKVRSFSGDLTQWTSFWESFEAAVHSRSDLMPVEKFNYLLSVLERSAREAISGLSLTAANYEETISTLKKRFGGKQKIIDKHMGAFTEGGGRY